MENERKIYKSGSPLRALLSAITQNLPRNSSILGSPGISRAGRMVQLHGDCVFNGVAQSSSDEFTIFIRESDHTDSWLHNEGLYELSKQVGTFVIPAEQRKVRRTCLRPRHNTRTIKEGGHHFKVNTYHLDAMRASQIRTRRVLVSSTAYSSQLVGQRNKRQSTSCSSCLFLYLDQPRISAMISITLGAASSAALLSMNASRVRRARTSTAFSAYSYHANKEENMFSSESGHHQTTSIHSGSSLLIITTQQINLSGYLWCQIR